MDLSGEERSSLQSLLQSDQYDGSMAARARIVLWWADGLSAAEIAIMAGTTKPTVYKWVDRYTESGLAGLASRRPPGRPRNVPGSVRGRILALTRQAPPEETGWTHWSSRKMADYLKRAEGISVSHNYVSELWREHDLQPHRIGTFKLSSD